MDYLEKCKQLVSAEFAMCRVRYRLNETTEKYPDVLRDLAEVVSTLFEIAKAEQGSDYQDIEQKYQRTT